MLPNISIRQSASMRLICMNLTPSGMLEITIAKFTLAQIGGIY